MRSAVMCLTVNYTRSPTHVLRKLSAALFCFSFFFFFSCIQIKSHIRPLKVVTHFSSLVCGGVRGGCTKGENQSSLLRSYPFAGWCPQRRSPGVFAGSIRAVANKMGRKCLKGWYWCTPFQPNTVHSNRSSLPLTTSWHAKLSCVKV